MEVYALVGPTGTGKSHLASQVAHRFGADLIIDDGLLIQGGSIVAGTSAKREKTSLAAVRRAIFQDPARAAGVKARIKELRPESVLVLGTSREMVDKICDALDLPRPERHLDIADVASRDEIRRARLVRRVEGKHVIPAPTFEVRKSFSGYMVDPLRFFYRARSRREPERMEEKSIVRPTFSSLGHFIIADSVVAAIVERAALEVHGVVGCHRVVVENRDEGVVVTLELVFRYGTRLIPVMERVHSHVSQVVEALTALNILSLEVVAQRVVPNE